MKSILQDIIANDTSYNKSATKMLKKTHPELWANIVNVTAFLPETAKPKQRIWHVLNDMYEIPCCPVENTPVRWHENRYFKYSDFATGRKAVGKLLEDANKGDNHWRSKDPSKAKKANKKFSKNLEAGNHKPFEDRDRDYKVAAKKAKQTCLKKYGVENGSQTKESRDKIYKAKLKQGCTPREERSLRRLYYDAVWKITEESWKNHFDSINPARLNRTYNALDHIYSIQQGFRDSIPPYIIGHYTNLRVISLSENGVKGMRCDKSQKKLFDDFFACIIIRLML